MYKIKDVLFKKLVLIFNFLININNSIKNGKH